MNPLSARYLMPYLRAAERHGGDFPTLLWATPETQSVRFDAIERLAPMHGKSVLDVGCGRADLIDFLHARGVRPADYIGVEAVTAVADAAEQKTLTIDAASIMRADFVKEPQRLDVGADVNVYSGSLNTEEEEDFYAVLRRAYDAAAEVLVFNFLCAESLAGASYLRWREPSEVLAFARKISPHVATLDDYLPGDCTVAIRHAPGE